MKKCILKSVLILLGLGVMCPAEVKEADVEAMKAAMPKTAPAKPKQKRKVLVYSRTAGFRHGSIPHGIKSMTLLGETTGAFEVTASEDPAMFEEETLKQFDGVIFLNTTGECLRPKKWSDDPEKKKAEMEKHEQLKANLVQFVLGGKGIIGMHSATDTYKKWKEFNEMMGGAFAGHPWHEDVAIKNIDPDNPLNKVFEGKGFSVKDEIYQFRDDTADAETRRMLLCLDCETVNCGKGKRKDGFYPISWVRPYGKGRNFYCSLGHRNEIWKNPMVLQHYLAGIQYALGDLDIADEPQTLKEDWKNRKTAPANK